MNLEVDKEQLALIKLLLKRQIDHMVDNWVILDTERSKKFLDLVNKVNAALKETQ